MVFVFCAKEVPLYILSPKNLSETENMKIQMVFISNRL